MKTSTILLTGLLLLTTNLLKAQQDAQFSQYMFNSIYVNPAYAGYREQLNFHTFYRNQWTGIDGAPKTLSFAIDAIANNGNVGLALHASSDKLGAQRNANVYADYAYRIRLNNNGSSRLAFGLGIGVVQLGLDGSLLNPIDNEAELPTGIQNTTLPDARAGAFLSNNKFFAGFSVDNLVSQYINENRFAYIPKPKPHYYVTAGILLPLSTDAVLKPSFLIKDDRGGPTSLDINAFIILADKLWLGAGYRTGVKLYNKDYLQKDLNAINSAVAAVQVRTGNNLRIGYAFDFSLNSLQGYSAGTHEIAISYFLNRKNLRMISPRYF
jgi:type IX secretion system PorP/SprF family membrane protein